MDASGYEIEEQLRKESEDMVRTDISNFNNLCSDLSSSLKKIETLMAREGSFKARDNELEGFNLIKDQFKSALDSISFDEYFNREEFDPKTREYSDCYLPSGVQVQSLQDYLYKVESNVYWKQGTPDTFIRSEKEKFRVNLEHLIRKVERWKGALLVTSDLREAVSVLGDSEIGKFNHDWVKRR